MTTKKAIEEEDLAIQNTLSLTTEERMELLASLIIDKIIVDLQKEPSIFEHVLESQHG